MLFEKIIQTKLDIAAPEAYCMGYPTYDDMYMAKLKNTFEKVCYRGCFVHEIRRIVRYSNIVCRSQDISGEFSVNIIFIALVEVIEPGTVVHGCKIDSIEEDTLYSKSEHLAISIHNNVKANIFNIGDEIPIIVNRSSYMVNKRVITLIAIPFQPVERKVICYEPTDDAATVDEGLIAVVFEETKAIEARISEIKRGNPKVYEYFVKLLYPFKEVRPVSGKTIDIYDMGKASGTLSRPVAQLDSKLVCIGSGTYTVRLPRVDCLYNLACEYKRDLETLIGFLERYPSPADIKKIHGIIALYNVLKK